MGKTVGDVVKEYFPDATESFIDHILWARTPFPAGTISGSLEGDIRHACEVVKNAKEKGIALCDMCDNPAVVGMLCESCHAALNGNHADDPTDR